MVGDRQQIVSDGVRDFIGLKGLPHLLVLTHTSIVRPVGRKVKQAIRMDEKLRETVRPSRRFSSRDVEDIEDCSVFRSVVDHW